MPGRHTISGFWCRRPIAVAIAIVAIAAAAIAGDEGTASRDDRRIAQLAELVESAMRKHQVPGVSFAVIDKYQIVSTQAFGRRSVEDEDKVTTTTRFQAASISKPVTAIAVVRLASQGRIELDKDINKQLKSWQLPESALGLERPVTPRLLLCHMAGTNVHGFVGYATGQPLPDLIQVLNGVKPANSPPIRLQIKPGYAFQYSGGGYCILQQLLIDVDRQTFPALMQSLVLEPVGMAHSSFEQPLPVKMTEQAAFGHRKSLKLLPGRFHTHPEMAAAGLWTTPTDLAKLLIDVCQSLSSNQGKLLTRSWAQDMVTPQNKHCGLGWFVKGRSTLEIGHSGGNEGFCCHMVAYPGTGDGLVVMTNSDTGRALIGEALGAAGELFDWPRAETTATR